MDAKRWSVAAVWAATLVAGVVIAVSVPGPLVYAALTLADAIAFVIGMIAQLAVGEQVGFVARLTAIACGSFAIVLLVALIRLLVGG
jgi:hypothetical protein